jgi:hypothetical protein
MPANLFLRLAERARPQQIGITQNVGIGSAGLTAQSLGSAWLAPCTILAINRVAGGLQALPARGFGGSALS